MFFPLNLKFNLYFRCKLAMINFFFIIGENLKLNAVLNTYVFNIIPLNHPLKHYFYFSLDPKI